MRRTAVDPPLAHGTLDRSADRATVDRVLAPARARAFLPAELVGQESFMRAAEILSLARRAGVGPDVRLLDLCCGVAGPGRFLVAELGCRYLGVDASPSAIDLARRRAGGLPCRFEVARVPPVPAGPFDVVLLLETLLAFPDKPSLLRGIASALAPGGRFAFTVEEGDPLTPAERAAMPHADTVWPVPLAGLRAALASVGLRLRWTEDHTAAHRRTADALARAFVAERAGIVAGLGRPAFDELVAAHRLWSDWLAAGRLRKLAVVAVREPDPEPRSR